MLARVFLGPLCATVNVAACYRAGDDTVTALLAYLNQARLQIGIEAAPASRLKLANFINGKIADFQPILDRNCAAGSFGIHIQSPCMNFCVQVHARTNIRPFVLAKKYCDSDRKIVTTATG